MRTAAIFSDYMVLQREKPVAVWGDGRDGQRVTVTLAGRSASCTVKNGKWRVMLPPMPAAAHLTMTVKSGAVQIVFREIAVGEVWLCGGQSNMEFEIKDEKNGGALLQTLHAGCPVRFYYTPKLRIRDEHFDAAERQSHWQTADPVSSRAWSAVGLYFGLELAEKLGVTVGLIGCNWGGTSASCWVSRDVLEAQSALRPYPDDYDRASAGKTEQEIAAEYDDYLTYQNQWWADYSALLIKHPGISWEDAAELIGASRWPGPMGPLNETRLCGCYETMLQRIMPYTLRGFLFYQGESDDHRPEAYETLLTALIECWRRNWADRDLPFLFVQLPMFCGDAETDRQHWCVIREAQANVYKKLRNTGLAVIPDCGEPDNIHPTDKAQVGHRLCMQALHHVYHRMSAEEACAPMLRQSYACGDTFIVETEHAADGFRLTGEPEGFEIAGTDGAFYPAKAVFCADRILLTAPQVPAPAFARYAWTDYMKITVFGQNGLPLAPFRTDRFPRPDLTQAQCPDGSAASAD